MSVEDQKTRGADEEPSPLLGRWRSVYALVIGELAVTIALLYALARWAS